MLKRLADEEISETKAEVLLEDAIDIIMSRRYPTFDMRPEFLPEQYELTAVRIAAYLFYREGSEGELSHSEGGVSRGYADANIPEDLLRDVVRVVKVLK